MKRLLCLDVGDVRIGIAMSDPMHLIASPHSVYTRVGWGPDTRYVKELFDRYDCEKIVCGLPLNMDGSEGFQAQKVKQLAAKFEEAGMPVVFQDERLTTVSAEDVLMEGGLHRQDRKRNVDKVAAAFILESYLEETR